MAPRKGQKKRFPLNAFLQIKREQDVQLASALAHDKEYRAKAKKLKRLDAKVKRHICQDVNSPKCLSLRL